MGGAILVVPGVGVWRRIEDVENWRDCVDVGSFACQHLNLHPTFD
jgi:hypothetical protein